MFRGLSLLFSASLLAACAEPPSGALMRDPTLLPEKTDGSSLELDETSGTLKIHSDIAVELPGEFMNDPEGEAKFSIEVDVTTARIARLDIPIGEHFEYDRTAKIGPEGTRTKAVVEPLKIRIERPVPAELVERLRLSCGDSERVFLTTTWTSTEFTEGPERFTIQPGKGEIPNTVDGPVVVVKCLDAEGEEEEDGAPAQ